MELKNIQMKKEIKTTNSIQASADRVWEILRTGKGVNTWLPIIETCEVNGSSRTCSHANGILEETILVSDDENKLFSYSIDKQDLFPFTNLVGVMQVVESNTDSCNLHWNASFDLPDESQFEEIKEKVSGLYQMGAKGLESLIHQKA